MCGDKATGYHYRCITCEGCKVWTSQLLPLPHRLSPHLTLRKALSTQHRRRLCPPVARSSPVTSSSLLPIHPRGHSQSLLRPPHRLRCLVSLSPGFLIWKVGIVVLPTHLTELWGERKAVIHIEHLKQQQIKKNKSKIRQQQTQKKHSVNVSHRHPFGVLGVRSLAYALSPSCHSLPERDRPQLKPTLVLFEMSLMDHLYP